MTFALIADGRIVDHVDAATLMELDTWLAGRRGPLAILHVRPGETARVGARVDVEEVEIGVATLATRRRAPVGAARTDKGAADAGRVPT